MSSSLRWCVINNGNRTEWSPIRSVIIWVINKIGRPRSGSPICISRVWLQTELDDTKSWSCYQLIIKITVPEKKKHNQVTKKGENLHWNTDKGGVNILLAKTQKQARARTRNYNFECMWLIDLNYIFECDWLIELSDNKLSNNKLSNNKLTDNNLANKLVENRTFLNQSQARKL